MFDQIIFISGPQRFRQQSFPGRTWQGSIWAIGIAGTIQLQSDVGCEESLSWRRETVRVGGIKERLLSPKDWHDRIEILEIQV